MRNGVKASTSLLVTFIFLIFRLPPTFIIGFSIVTSSWVQFSVDQIILIYRVAYSKSYQRTFGVCVCARVRARPSVLLSVCTVIQYYKTLIDGLSRWRLPLTPCHQQRHHVGGANLRGGNYTSAIQWRVLDVVVMDCR